MEEVILGKPTKDTTKALITLGLKHIFKKVDEGEEEIQILRKQNKVLSGYVWEVVGPIHLVNPKIALVAALEKQVLAPTPMDSFLEAW